MTTPDNQAHADENRPNLEEVISCLKIENVHAWAWRNYKSTAETLIHTTGAKRVLEIGGGRDPLFSASEAANLNISLTINDISESELSRAPPGYDTACFDIAGDLPAGCRIGVYDLVISRMVLEHVHDGQRAWRNMLDLLAPGGVAFAFFPTLYSPPFVANLLLPEAVATRILRWLSPNRHYDGVPKFPARYSWCFAGERRMIRMLKDAGFAQAFVIPFYGTTYLNRVPVLRKLYRACSDTARRRDWRAVASFAYVIAAKSP